jgi:hypothetical protein
MCPVYNTLLEIYLSILNLLMTKLHSCSSISQMARLVLATATVNEGSTATGMTHGNYMKK